MDIFKLKKVYLIGIKGSGVSALALILKSLKINVVGSDTKEKFFTDEVLKKEKIKFYEGFKKENLKKELPIDLVISSVAYLTKKYHPEIDLTKKLNIPILSFPQALSLIFNQCFGIAICGSHGKSSTTAILGSIFKDANLDPTCLVGSSIISWKSNALVSKKLKEKIKFLKNNEKNLNNLNWLRRNLKKLPIFIIEADEYKEAFLNYFPRIILITNIDYDHPDYFKKEIDYKNAFKKFIKNLKEPKILITYADKRGLTTRIDADKYQSESALKTFPFPFPGIHWQKNLNLIYQLIKILKIPKKIFLKSIKNYQGIKRRFEIIKHKNDIYLIDDYGHHPNEVFSFYQSLKDKFPNYKIFFIFQPHTYTRTHFLFDQFKKVFSKIKKDKNINLIIFKTFPSAREKDILLKIKKLKKETDLARKLNLLYFKKEKELIKFLEKNLKPKTVITTVGAGNLYKILEKLKL